MRDRLVDLLDEGRLTDAALARDHHGLDAAARDTLEALQQHLGLRGAPIKLLRGLEAVHRIVKPKRESFELPARRERCAALPQIRREAGRALVAVLRFLLEQLHHDVG